jgi:hypothetical protein
MLPAGATTVPAGHACRSDATTSAHSLDKPASASGTSQALPLIDRPDIIVCADCPVT